MEGTSWMEEMPYGSYGRQPAFAFSQNWKSILLLFFIEKVEKNLRMESDKTKTNAEVSN